jgi:DNA polymerase-3 subunit gamma/tau
MLSRNAFNALLKTLEEPPPHAKFVFATTEIQKVPLTVLSRCQRFSLRRVPVEMLAEHYRRIAEAEAVEAEPAALALIARAADGSVRDGLSLLDQAIALTDGKVTERAARDMLGIADRGRVFDLLENVLGGDAAAALDRLDRLYQEGADPLMVLQDLLDLSHFLTRLQLAPEAGLGDPIVEGDRERAAPLAAKLTLPALARVWQMLLKGLEEVQTAPSPIQAAEMVLVRLAYVADLPAPAELVRSLATPSVPSGLPTAEAPTAVRTSGAQSSPPPEPRVTVPSASAAATALVATPRAEPVESVSPPPATSVEHDPMPQSFADVVALFDKRREAVIRSHLRERVHLLAFEPGRIEFRPADGAPANLANRISQLLGEWTGERWLVAPSKASAGGEPTLREQEERRERDVRNEVAAHPLVQAVLETFPGATVTAVRERFAAEESAADEPSAELDPGDETSMGEDER